MWDARLRLASLWGSQVARVLAENTFRILLVLGGIVSGGAPAESAWHGVTALLMFPAVVFAPFNGALCNALPKPVVLRGAALLALIGVIGVSLGVWGQGAAWIVVAIAAALYASTRLALMPAGAESSHVSLPGANSLFEAGSGAAVVAGMILCVQLLDANATVPAFWIVMIAFALALVLALPVHFATDLRRRESPGQAIFGFFRDVARIWREREARWCLMGLASLRGLITGMTGALIAATVAGETRDFSPLITIGVYVIGGVAAGSLLAGLQRHPRRVLGLVPWGATGLTIGLIIAALGGIPGPTLCVILGIMAGLVNVPLVATYQADVPPDARGNAMAVRNLADNSFIALMSFLLFALATWAGWGAAAQLALVAALAALLALSSWWFLRREVLELLIEGCFAIMYRFRFYGPGRDEVPLRGPLVVIANHACYMDPMLLGKVIPRTLIPMMTSNFFDLPGLRWLMSRVFRAIRVEASTFRRDVPELDSAIRRLDEGASLVLFPEGWMRRRDDRSLRHFGQGIWHILRARPNTPIVVCWLEGTWGSYFSHKGGAPMKNKRFDVRRPIDIVIGVPHTLPPEVLEDHQATRTLLMRECLELRRCLGLEVPEDVPAAASEEARDLAG